MKKDAISEEIDKSWPEFIKLLKEEMKIPSYKSFAQANAPYGNGPKQALEKAMQIGTELGFETKIVSNAVGYVQLGDSPDYVGILGHLDVVSVADDWDYPPFDLTEKDGNFYGRGILDNKGPIMACLFGLSILKRLDLKMTKTVRILFGTDEESGSSDIPLYLENNKPPMYGFTPDCKYPAVYGERGILGVELRTKISDKSLQQIIHLSGEFNRSYIPEKAELQLVGKPVQYFNGKKAPSNAPYLARNVIPLIAKTAQKLEGETGTFFRWYLEKIGEEYDGKSLGINFEDAMSGALQLSVYEIVIKEDEICLSFSIRYPISVTEEQIIKQLRTNLLSNTRLVIHRRIPAMKFPVDHPMIEIMRLIYEEVTGLDGTPVTTTGATYARSMPNIIAFGPSFPGQKGIAHKGNEYMAAVDLKKNLEIYTRTIYALSK